MTVPTQGGLYGAERDTLWTSRRGLGPLWRRWHGLTALPTPTLSSRARCWGAGGTPPQSPAATAPPEGAPRRGRSACGDSSPGGGAKEGDVAFGDSSPEGAPRLTGYCSGRDVIAGSTATGLSACSAWAPGTRPRAERSKPHPVRGMSGETDKPLSRCGDSSPQGGARRGHLIRPCGALPLKGKCFIRRKYEKKTNEKMTGRRWPL
jgi:hypothetical protein